MTLKERVIVETYTGICMVTGNERNEVYKYQEEIMGRPVFSHELADEKIQEELRLAALEDFKALCVSEESVEESGAAAVIQLEVKDNSPMQIAYAIRNYIWEYYRDKYEIALIALDELTEHIDAYVRAERKALEYKKLAEEG